VGIAAPLVGNVGRPARAAPDMRVCDTGYVGLQRGLIQRDCGTTRPTCNLRKNNRRVARMMKQWLVITHR